MTSTVVQLNAVSRFYWSGRRRVAALVDVNLAIRAGEVVGIQGRSGSGKTTLARILAGMEAPSAGEVAFAGMSAWARRRMGTMRRVPRPGFAMPVFQDPVAGLEPRWPIWRSITEPLTPGWTRRSGRERRARAAAALASVGLENIDVEARPHQLSVGQCQRACVLRALIARPALIVADEPTSALDVMTAAATMTLLRQAAESGVAVVVVSHDLPLLSAVADRIGRMDRGRLGAGGATT